MHLYIPCLRVFRTCQTKKVFFFRCICYCGTTWTHFHHNFFLLIISIRNITTNRQTSVNKKSWIFQTKFLLYLCWHFCPRNVVDWGCEWDQFAKQTPTPSALALDYEEIRILEKELWFQKSNLGTVFIRNSSLFILLTSLFDVKKLFIRTLLNFWFQVFYLTFPWW